MALDLLNLKHANLRFCMKTHALKKHMLSLYCRDKTNYWNVSPKFLSRCNADSDWMPVGARAPVRPKHNGIVKRRAVVRDA